MKRIYTALALLAAAGISVSAQAYKSVAVNLADGGKVEVNLADDLSATFDNDNLLITGGGQDVAVLRSTIKSFTFSEKEFSGIDNVSADGSAPVISGGSMVFSDLPAGSLVAVYTADGALVSQAAVNGAYTLYLSALPAGTVIVNVNGVAYKIATRK
ncbi:MAG: hypothetical protein K2G30_05080 [Muribaculaceae bacterium]|nr:hypothetical protein [Muribaculaceae bacterium]MDE7142150.1 hypothetical protein [Muribaculaceae bacterium]